MHTKSFFQGIATGGRRSIDLALLGVQRDDYIITCDSWFASGGPLDAPSYLPAGSVENHGATNWRGRPVIMQRETIRD